MTTIKTICFIGAGHVGAPTATILAFFNPTLNVTVVDKSEPLVRQWNSRHIPLRDEPALRYLVRVARDGTLPTLMWSDDDNQTVERPARKPNLLFSTDVGGSLARADMVFLCVETPTRMEGAGCGMAVNTASLEKAVADVAEYGMDGIVVVVKSTVPVGMAKVVREMIAAARPKMSFEVLSNPEFLSQGKAVKNLLFPDRVLIGHSMASTGHAAASSLKTIYRSWVDPTKIQVMGSPSAELAKLAANAMLAQRISSINAISNLCERSGADIDHVRIALGSDPRVGPDYLQAGIGFGGSCLEKDVLGLVHLAESLGLPGPGEYWVQVLRMNDFQTQHFVRRVVRSLDGSLSGKKIAVLGWTFKKATNDTRGTRSAHVLKALLEQLATEIAVFDPICDPARVEEEVDSIKRSVILPNANPKLPHDNNNNNNNNNKGILVHDNPYTACRGAKAILILTDWDHFRCPPRRGGGSSLTPFKSIQVDGHYAFDPAAAAAAAASPFSFSWTDCATSPPRPPTTNPPRSCRPGTPNSSSTTTTTTDHRHGHGHAYPKPHSIQDPASTRQLKPDLPCPPHCRDCSRSSASASASASSSSSPSSSPCCWGQTNDQIDWRRISMLMRSPRWVFDGRNVVDVAEMVKLGFRVEAIGKAG